MSKFLKINLTLEKLWNFGYIVSVKIVVSISSNIWNSPAGRLESYKQVHKTSTERSNVLVVMLSLPGWWNRAENHERLNRAVGCLWGPHTGRELSRKRRENFELKYFLIWSVVSSKICRVCPRGDHGTLLCSGFHYKIYANGGALFWLSTWEGHLGDLWVHEDVSRKN